MHSQKKPTEDGFLEMAKEDGKFMLAEDEMIAGMLLEMATGHANTPKGGLRELANAIESGKARPEWAGKFGNGAYKDEPWGIVAMRKRVYSLRAWYQRKLAMAAVTPAAYVVRMMGHTFHASFAGSFARFVSSIIILPIPVWG